METIALDMTVESIVSHSLPTTRALRTVTGFVSQVSPTFSPYFPSLVHCVTTHSACARARLYNILYVQEEA